LVGITEENIEMKVRISALAFGFFLVVGLSFAASAGPAPGGTDTDGDLIEDAFDNCTLVANADQADDTSLPGNVDHDGCGNACQPPVICDTVGGDLKVGAPEFGAVLGQFGNECDLNTALDCSADCTGDDKVGSC
jgi:hypothetical protein